MTLNEQILGFLDGTLSGDTEAELLHILSVSPERREALRSFMRQKALFARDRQSIQVPYKAEQALWTRLGAVMPALPAVQAAENLMPSAPSAVEATSNAPLLRAPAPVSFFSKIFSGASMTVGAVTLMLGLGLGYFARPDTALTLSNGGSSVSQSSARGSSAAISAPSISSNAAAANVAKTELTQPATRVITRTIIKPVYISSIHQVPNTRYSAQSASSSESKHTSVEGTDLTALVRAARGDNSITQSAEPQVTPVPALRSEPLALNDIGGPDGGIRPIFLHTQDVRPVEKSLLQRFEFTFDESFGRQYPNSAATNNSLPLITNSAIGTFFQVLPHSDALWVGLNVGTANVTKKSLFTRLGDPLDPLQIQLAADTVHAQTGYVAGFLQYRVPALPNTELLFSAGYGVASLGNMMIGELAMHYDVSREVGILMGIRGVNFSYDLTNEINAARQPGQEPLSVKNGVADATPSFNLEVSTGLFFHF